MKRWLPVILVLLVFACKEKKIDFSGEAPLKAEDFITAFPKITGSFMMADSNLIKKADTTRIGYKALVQFIPDSTILPFTNKDHKTIIRPVGIIEKEKENYLLINFTKQRKTTTAVFVTDKKMRFLAYKELLNNQKTDGYYRFVSINKEPTFLINREKALPDLTLKFSRAGWVYNAEGFFMLVINDSNEDPEKTAVINPIDTLPRNNKWSGDYVRNDKNYISIRDGKNANHYLFFIHFEKDKGRCTGELKGELKLKNGTSAVFIQSGDPCIIDFTLSGNYITVKEQGSCGNHRGIQCFFDDSYRKKKEPKTKKKKSS